MPVVKLGTQTRDLSGRALQQALLEGWEPVDPSERIIIAGYRDGAPDARPLTIGNFLREYQSTVGGIMIPDEGEGRNIIAQAGQRTQERLRQERLGTPGMRAATAVMNATNTVSLGLGAMLGGAINPEGGRLFQEMSEENAGSALMGQLAGLGVSLLSGGIAGSAGSLGGRAALSLAGPGAMAVRAGQFASRGAATLVGENPGLVGRLFVRGAGLVAEESAGVAGFHVMDALSSDRELSAEQMLSDTGWSIAAGVGIEGLLGAGALGINRLSRALRRSEASTEIVNAGRIRHLDEGAPTDATADEMIERIRRPIGEQYPDRDLTYRLKVPLQRMTTQLDDETLGLVNSPAARRDAAMADANMPAHADRLAPVIRNLEEGGHDFFTAVRAENRLDVFDDAFSVAETNPLLRQEIDNHLSGINRGMDALVESKSGLYSKAGSARFREVRDAIEAVRSRVGVGSKTGAKEVYTELRRLERRMSSLADDAFAPTERLNSVDKDILIGAMRDIRSLTGTGEGATLTGAPARRLWGDRLVDVESEGGRLVGSLKERAQGLARAVKEANIEGTGKTVTSEKVLRLLRKMGKEGEDATIFTGLVNYAVETKAAAKFFADNYGASSAIAAGLGREADSLLRVLDKASTDAKLLTKFNAIISRQHRLGTAPVGAVAAGGIAGIATGSPLAAVGAAMGSLYFDHIFRPGSASLRLGALSNMMQRVTARRTRAIGRLRSRVRSSIAAAGKTRVSAKGAGRAVPYTVFALTSKEKREEEFGRLRDTLDEFAANPDRLVDHMGVSAVGVGAVDPDMVGPFQEATVRGFQFLHASLPRTPVDPVTQQPAFNPSQSEMQAFIEKYIGVEDPMSMLEDFVEGRLTQEKARAVQAVYPRLHSEMVLDIVSVLSEFQGKIPYQYRVRASVLLDQQMDVSLTSEFVLSMQNLGAQTEQEDATINSPRPRRQGVASPPSVTNQFTELQRVLQ